MILKNALVFVLLAACYHAHRPPPGIDSGGDPTHTIPAMSMKTNLQLLLAAALSLCIPSGGRAADFDVVVYGGTSGATIFRF